MKIQLEGYLGAATITAGAADLVPGRGVQIVATVAGDVSFRMADGAANVVPVAVGLTILPFAVRGVNTAGTTATATFKTLA